MKQLNSSEMREIDRHATEVIGIKEEKLMELAGLKIAEFVRDKFEPQKIRVFSGKGNNGGDGLVAARKLSEWGFDPVVSVIGKPRQIPAHELAIIRKLGLKLKEYDKEIGLDILIDSIFGYSIKGDPREPYGSAIRNINDSEAEVISVDVPSGLNPEEGKKADPAVIPDHVLCLAAPKKGLNLFEAEKYLLDIGIHSKSYRDFGYEKPNQLKKKDRIRI